MLKRFDPPAFLEEFNNIPNQLDAWSEVISSSFQNSIASVESPSAGVPPNPPDSEYPGVGVGRSQYYNATKTDTVGPVIDVPITWLGFPRTLKVQYGDAAWARAEELQPLDVALGAPELKGLVYRPQDEYCEWHAERDAEGKLTRVVFTSEGPEYWSALAQGYPSPGFYYAGPQSFAAKGDPARLLALYRSFCGPAVELEDLFFQDDARAPSFKKGEYNPYNKWNTTDGAVHLCQPNNTLLAEIQLGADATILRQLGGKLLVDADQLVSSAGYGGVNRSSDPNIGFSVNQVVRLGAMATIANPVGLYMHGLNVVGWTKPDGKTPVGNYWSVVRGNAAGRVLRAVYEVPRSEGFRVGDILIGGVPIDYAGQIADNITVTLTAEAFIPPGRQPNPALIGQYTAFRSQKVHAFLRSAALGATPPEGFEAVELGIGVTQALPPAPAAAEVAARALAAPGPPPVKLSHVGKRVVL